MITIFLSLLLSANPQEEAINQLLLQWDQQKADIQKAKKQVALPNDDPDLLNKKWYRWTTKNFIILSLDQKQGIYLFNNIEDIKKSILAKWGLPDINFSSECKVLCVKDQNLFKKLFNLDQSKVEIRENLDVLFLLLDGPPHQTFIPYFSEVVLSEFFNKYNLKLNIWTRGMSLLTQPVSNIRKDIVSLHNQNLFSAKEILEMTQKELRDKNLFDCQSEVLCLMLRKEFGQRKFHTLLKSLGKGKSAARCFNEIYGFKSLEQFDVKYKQYIKDLSSDIKNSKTPDSYLEI